MNILPIAVLAVLAALLGLGLVWALMERSRERSRADLLAERLETQGPALAEAVARARMLESQEEQVKAQTALTANLVAEELLKRNTEAMRSQELLATARLEAQLKPVAETLAKFETQVQALEKSRAEENGGLKEQIAALMQASTATQAEARKLSSALRRGAGVQGRWGEQTLRNVLETAGLAARFDFEEQFSVDTEEGRRRPDVKVRMPGGGVFVIDAKCSLNAFLEAQDALDDAGRDAAYVRHAASVRAHMQGLSAKTYWDQFQDEGSPDFVAMFVPGDGFLAAALDRLPDLLSEAMTRRVLLVTPTTLFALCKAVAYGWRVEEQSRGAADIAKLGRELHKRLAVMGSHVDGVGRALSQAVSRYNSFVGSLESQVLTQARRFEELAVDHEGKSLDELAPVETAVRPLTKLADSDASGRDEGSNLTLKAG